MDAFYTDLPIQTYITSISAPFYIGMFTFPNGSTFRWDGRLRVAFKVIF